MGWSNRATKLPTSAKRWRKQHQLRKIKMLFCLVMASTTSSSFQNKMSKIEARLRAENEALKRDKVQTSLDLDLHLSPRRQRPTLSLQQPYGRSSSAPSPTLNTSMGRQPRPQGLPGPIHNIHKPPDSAEIDRKLKEIMEQTGILTCNGNQKYKADIADLELLGELGNGTCGHVVKMRHKPSTQVIAVKQMRRSGNKEENKRIIMDLEVVLKSHDSPYIVQCVGVFVTDSDVWICMELMATCLDKLMKRLRAPIPEKILGKMAVAIVKALHYLKETHGVIHRDVKPSNILLDWNGTVKLCDFGISGRLVDSKAKTRSAGCAAYMAPERIDPPDPTKPDYDIRADVWSLGISLVELATGEFPYGDCRNDFEVLTKVLQEAPPLLPKNAGFSINFHSFVQSCLTKDYRKRPKYKQLLQHPFVKHYEMATVDAAHWFAEVMRKTETPSPSNPLFPGMTS